MTLGQSLKHTIVWNIIQIQHDSKKLWPAQKILLSMHCDLDFGDMNLGQGHDITLGHWQPLCKILWKKQHDIKKLWPGHLNMKVLAWGNFCAFYDIIRLWKFPMGKLNQQQSVKNYDSQLVCEDWTGTFSLRHNHIKTTNHI